MSGTIKELADRLADARLRKDEADEVAKVYQGQYDEVEAELFDAMENAGMSSVRTERGLFRLNDLAWASIEDAERAREWAAAFMPELLTLNNQRLSKLVRDTLKGDAVVDGADDGTNLPPGVGFKTSRKVTWRRQ